MLAEQQSQRIDEDENCFSAIKELDLEEAIEEILDIYEDNSMPKGAEGGISVAAQMQRVRRAWSACSSEGKEEGWMAVGKSLDGLLLFGQTPGELRPISNLLTVLELRSSRNMIFKARDKAVGRLLQS